MLRKFSFFALLFMLSMSAMASAVIPSGTTLLPGQYIFSTSGDFAFGIDENDSNLYFRYEFPSAAWGVSSNSQLFGTSSTGAVSAGKGDSLVMQADGNLVLYSAGVAVWSRGNSVPGSYAVVEDFGDVIIYPPQGVYPESAWPFAAVTPNLGRSTGVNGVPFVVAFAKDTGGNELFNVENNQNYYVWYDTFSADSMEMGADGNLNVYFQNNVVWTSGTSGNPGAYAIVTPVGFVIGKQSSGILANPGYPVPVTASHKARAPGQPAAKTIDSNPDLLLPITAAWSCYILGSGPGYTCFAPG